MSMFYQPVTIAANGPKRNHGLRFILEEIGRNEYCIMERRAIREGKDAFFFPSGHIQKSEKIECIVGRKSPIPNDLYYKQGVFRINKETGMGGRNKTAIRLLVDAIDKDERDGNGYLGTYTVFMLHRIKAERIFAAIHRYIKKDYLLPINILVGSKSKNLMEQTKRRVFGNGVPSRSGADIIATPYYAEIKRRNVNFVGRDGILYQIRAFNSFTGEAGVL